MLPLLVAACQKEAVAQQRRWPLPLAMPQASHEKLARDRVSYAKRRLRKLRAICPELPADILERTSLRTLTYAVHRARPYQTALKPAPREAGQTTLPRGASALVAEEVRSNRQLVDQA